MSHETLNPAPWEQNTEPVGFSMSRSGFDNSDTVYNFDLRDSDDERLNTLAQQIYNQHGLTGILKLMDRFIYTVGPVHAIKIMEAYIDESNTN